MRFTEEIARKAAKFLMKDIDESGETGSNIQSLAESIQHEELDVQYACVAGLGGMTSQALLVCNLKKLGSKINV